MPPDEIAGDFNVPGGVSSALVIWAAMFFDQSPRCPQLPCIQASIVAEFDPGFQPKLCLATRTGDVPHWQRASSREKK
jgi:hypothetical protein